jgi:phosphoribosyl 1,2-cyclic phosphodiesterase
VRVFVLGSGSTGNCLVVEADGERIVVDAGMGPVRASERMRALGADLISTHPPLGLFITHEHGDHAAHALPLARALRTPLFAHAGAALDRARRKLQVVAYVPGTPVMLGPFVVEALGIPHDAPQVALRISAGGHRFAIATDLGHAPRELRTLLGASDVVMLEANYCPGLLESGPYPPRLKQRVAGLVGHLANDQAADVARSLEDTRVARLVLAHLSRTNNSPERAHAAVASAVRRLPVEALPHGEPRLLDVSTSRRAPSVSRDEQLGFAF